MRPLEVRDMALRGGLLACFARPFTHSLQQSPPMHTMVAIDMPLVTASCIRLFGQRAQVPGTRRMRCRAACCLLAQPGPSRAACGSRPQCTPRSASDMLAVTTASRRHFGQCAQGPGAHLARGAAWRGACWFCQAPRAQHAAATADAHHGLNSTQLFLYYSK
jgi:hypothetical protein